MHPSTAFLPILCLLTTLSAQAPTLDPTRITIGVGAGLQRDGDQLLGCGTDYKATFADGQLVYTPALGRAASHDLPLAMQVTHVGRGVLTPVGPATTAVGDLRVDFVRGEVREQLELRPEGLKQSFVFDRLPAGEGDLVVRAAIATELQPERNASDGALRFTLPGVGGVEVGQVVGIAADGARVTGSLRSDGRTLDFVLPAAFVSNARLPLVVDPLLTTHTVTNQTGEDRQPEVCSMQAPANSYLVVWARPISASNNDVRAQRVSSTGALLGGLLQLESSNVSANDITVVDNQANAKWFVCWEQGSDIVGRFVTAAGVANPVITVAGGANSQIEPDLAGGRFGTTSLVDDLFCVWHDSTSNAIKTSRIDAGLETAGTEHVVAAGSATLTVAQPAASPDNPSSRFLVAYVTTSSLLGSRAVRAAVVEGSTVTVSSNVAIAGTALVDAVDPSCAGNGGRWVVAYTSNGLLGSSLACTSVEVFASQTVVGTPRTITGPNGAGSNASVGWFDGSAFVAFTSVGTGGGSNRDVSVFSVDSFTCTTCEGLLPIDLGSVDVDVAIASRVGNTPSVNQGAVVYVPLTTLVGNIEMRLLNAADGVTTAMGGGCTNGVLSAPCARAGNSAFTVQMRGGPASELTFAVHSTGSFGATGFPCGPCSIVPDSTIGIVQTVGVSTGDGAMAIPLPLPGGASVVGVNVFSQAFFLGSDCLNLFKLTDAIRYTIE